MPSSEQLIFDVMRDGFAEDMFWQWPLCVFVAAFFLVIPLLTVWARFYPDSEQAKGLAQIKAGNAPRILHWAAWHPKMFSVLVLIVSSALPMYGLLERQSDKFRLQQGDYVTWSGILALPGQDYPTC